MRGFLKTKLASFLKTGGVFGIASLCLVFSIFLFSINAFSIDLPGSADPSRALERLDFEKQKLEKLENGLEVIEDKTKKPPEVKNGFMLNGVKLVGAEALPKDAYEQIYKEFIGKQADINILLFIVNEITNLYRKNGYFLSKAYLPEQEVEDGIFTINVLEGYISEVNFEENNKPYKFKADYFDLINKFKKQILDMRPLNALELESIILKINSLPGINARSVISNISDADSKDGSVALDVQITEEKSVGSISLDNFGSRFTGPWQALASYNFSPKVFSFDSLKVNLLNSIPTDEINLLSVNYETALTTNASLVGFNFSKSNTAPGFTLKSNDIKSESINYGIYFDSPIKISREKSLNMKFGLNFKNVRSDFFNTKLYEDEIRVAEIGFDFESQDKFGGINTGNLTVSKGLNILNAKETGSSLMSRAEGKSDFTKISLSQNRLQQISESYQIFFSISGQYSADPLLSSEEFGYGGQSYGRAYDPSEIIGDSGSSGLIELRYNNLNVFKNLYSQPYIFYDLGKVWNNDKGTNENKAASSTGIGLRFGYDNAISGNIGFAFPLIKEVETPINGNSSSPRLYFSIIYKF